MQRTVALPISSDKVPGFELVSVNYTYEPTLGSPPYEQTSIKTLESQALQSSSSLVPSSANFVGKVTQHEYPAACQILSLFGGMVGYITSVGVTAVYLGGEWAGLYTLGLPLIGAWIWRYQNRWQQQKNTLHTDQAFYISKKSKPRKEEEKSNTY